MVRHSLLLCCICLAGCGLPLTTNSRVTLDGPLVGQASVEMAASTPSAKGPVIEMPIGPANGAAKVAVIDVDGLLVNQNLDGAILPGDNPVAVFQEKLQAARQDAQVCAIVVRIHSPGGGVTASDMMLQQLRRFRVETGKPVVACLLDVAAGGAYYIATGADRIVAHPTTITGGIGVIWNSYNLRDLMAQFNIMPQPVKAGPNIDMGSTTRNLTPETKKLLQEIADEFHERFKKVVRDSRLKANPNDEAIFDGQVFTASAALKMGLIDSIGYLDDAIAAARELAGKPSANVVLYHRRNDPAYSPFSVSGNLHQGNQLLPLHIPGIQRTRLPTFLYLWQPDPALDR